MHKLLAQNLNIPWGANSGGSATVEGPEGFAFSDVTLGAVINSALDYIIPFAGFGFLLMLVSAGYALLTSAGDPKKMEGAKSRMTNALIGLVVILVAYWIVQIVGEIFDIEEIRNSF